MATPKTYRARVKKKPIPTPYIKESATLREYLEADKQQNLLLGPVAKYLQLKDDPRDAMVIHPSEMAKGDWCPRATWKRLTGQPLPMPKPLTFRNHLIFAEGREIHSKWQTWLEEMNALWGRWECLVCGAETEGWVDEISRSGCLHGGSHLWDYREVPLVYPDFRIAGHADGIFNLSDEDLLLEAKSIGPGTIRMLNLLSDEESDDLASTKFGKITAILGDHLRQTQIYLALTHESPTTPSVERAVVLYEHKADQQAREFVIRRREHYVEPLFETAHDIVWAIDKGREIACPHGGCKYCTVEE